MHSSFKTNVGIYTHFDEWKHQVLVFMIHVLEFWSSAFKLCSKFCFMQFFTISLFKHMNTFFFIYISKKQRLIYMFVFYFYSFQWLDYPFPKPNLMTFTFPMLQMQQLQSKGGTTCSRCASWSLLKKLQFPKSS
jgi:hypothetical protein